MESKKFRNKQIGDSYYDSLFQELISIQGEIDSIKGDFDLGKVFFILENSFLKHNITILLSLLTDKKTNLNFRFSSLKDNLASVFEIITPNNKSSLENCPAYKQSLKQKKAIFFKGRERDLIKKNKEAKKIYSEFKADIDSIITPMIIKGEVIGFLEFFSNKLNENFIEMFGVFSEKLVKTIANAILFQEIKNSEKKYRDIFENSNEGFYILNARQKRFVDVNMAMAKITGYTKEELRQMNYLVIFLPSERKRIDGIVKVRLEDPYSKNIPSEYETSIVTKHGEERSISIKVSRIINNDEWFVIVKDITARSIAVEELKKSELRLSEAQKIAKLGSWELFVKTSYLFLSDEIYTIFEIEKNGKQVKYRDFLEFISEEERMKVNNVIKNAILKGEMIDVDYPVILKDGTEKYIHLHAKIILGKNNVPVKAMGTVHDISDIKKSEKGLKESHDVQLALNRLLQISIEDMTLDKMLEKLFASLLMVPWINIEARGGIWLAKNSSSNKLDLIVSRGLSRDVKKHCKQITIGECVCGRTALTGKKEMFSSLTHSNHKENVGKTENHGHCCLPIMTNKKIFGILNFYLQAGSRYSEREIAFLEAVSNIIAGAVERNNVKNEIEKSEKKYRSLIDNASDMVVIIEKDMKIAFYNNSFSQRFFEKIKNVSFFDVIHSPDKKNILDEFKNMIETGKPKKDLEFRLISPSDDMIYVSASCSIIKKEGETIGIQAILRDVTENKIALEEIRRLDEFKRKVLVNSPVSIVMLDPRGRIVLLNNYAKRLLTEKAVGTKLIDQLEIKKNKELKQKYDDLLKKGKSFKYDGLSYLSHDQITKKFLNIIAVPLFDENRKVEGAISMALDNTEEIMAKSNLVHLNEVLERKVEKRTKELSSLNEKLNKALELKLKFISDASHELRTPLTIIKGNIDLVKWGKGAEKDEIAETLNDIEDEVLRMSGIISELTMLTNIDSNSEIVQFEEIDVKKVLESTSKSLEILCKEKDISINLKLISKNLLVRGDEAKLDKLFINIIRNAIKYTDDRGKIVILAKKEKGNIFVSIKDNGIGIPEEDLPYIFERFYRVDKARSRKEGGTGLGLSICKWIVEAHKGSIEVVSKEGEGSNFIIRFPSVEKS